MEKNVYEEPQTEIIHFCTEDVITDSTDDDHFEEL